MTRPAAVLFDIGDTLLREVRFDLEAGICAALPPHLRDRAGDLARSFRRELDTAHAARRELMLSRWLCARVVDLRELSPDAVEDAIWPEVVTLRPTPGARQLLERLHADGVRIGAISNAFFSGRVLREELTRHGLASALEFVLSSADLGVRKPDVRIFNEAVARLGVPAERTWFVGDTFEEDIEGALTAGLTPLWLRDWTELAELYASTSIDA